MKNFLFLAAFLSACTGAVLPSGQEDPAPVAAGECDCTVHNALDDGGVSTADAAVADDAGVDAGVDAGPPPPPLMCSGSRLKMIYVTSTDGLRVPRGTETLFDSDMNLKCRVTDLRTSIRCVPVSIAKNELMLFNTDSCVQQIAVLDLTGQPPSFVMMADPVDNAFGLVNLRGDEFTGDLFQRRLDGVCISFPRESLPRNFRVFDLGNDVTSTLAEVSEEVIQ